MKKIISEASIKVNENFINSILNVYKNIDRKKIVSKPITLGTFFIKPKDIIPQNISSRDYKIGLLYFLFYHIYSDNKNISRIFSSSNRNPLIEKFLVDPETSYEQYKFVLNLKEELALNSSVLNFPLELRYINDKNAGFGGSIYKQHLNLKQLYSEQRSPVLTINLGKSEQELKISLTHELRHFIQKTISEIITLGKEINNFFKNPLNHTNTLNYQQITISLKNIFGLPTEKTYLRQNIPLEKIDKETKKKYTLKSKDDLYLLDDNEFKVALSEFIDKFFEIISKKYPEMISNLNEENYLDKSNNLIKFLFGSGRKEFYVFGEKKYFYFILKNKSIFGAEDANFFFDFLNANLKFRKKGLISNLTRFMQEKLRNFIKENKLTEAIFGKNNFI